MTTPEQIYSIWRREGIKAKNKDVSSVGDVKNFDEAKSKPGWHFIESCAALLNRSQMIDPNLYIRAIAQDCGGFPMLSDLVGARAISIYKKYVNSLRSNVDTVYDRYMESIVNMINYCSENNIKNIDEYLSDNMYVFPTSIKHLNSCLISEEFFVSSNKIFVYLRKYPADIKRDFLGNDILDYSRADSNIKINDKLIKIRNNFDHVIESLLLKRSREKIQNKS